jgi:hypothetical protein
MNNQPHEAHVEDEKDEYGLAPARARYPIALNVYLVVDKTPAIS